MNSSWPRVAISDVAETVAMGPFGSSIKVETFVSEGVPIISGQHLKGLRVDDSSGHNFITEDHALKLKKANVHPGDVVLTHAGNIGQVAYIPETALYDTYVISQRQFFIRCDTARLLPEFLTYYLHSPEGHHALMANAVQTGVPSIAQPVSFVRTLEVPLPDIEVQQAIVDVLGALEDKIESNRSAQIQGAELLRAHVDAAFQSVPACDSRLDAYCELVKDGVRVDALDPTDNYIALEHMPRGSIFLAEWTVADGIGSNKSRFQVGDILFGKLRPYFRKVGVAPISGICSTDILVLRPKHEYDRSVVAAVASSQALIDSVTSASTGTRMPRASWSDLAAWPVPLLSDTERQRLGDVTSPLLERLTRLTHETRKLAALRDALIPGLLSGGLQLQSAPRESTRAAV